MEAGRGRSLLDLPRVGGMNCSRLSEAAAESRRNGQSSLLEGGVDAQTYQLR
jgi:hypothetical protein